MPKAKGELKPRGRMTAYAFFVQAAREEQKRLNPSGAVAFAEFSKACAGRWNALSDEQKQPFKAMAEQDKNRFDNEMRNFPGLKKRGKKGKKDPNAPKRSLSAFFWFCNDERQKVKDMNPEYGIGDVAKELGRLWAVVTPETKQKYQAMSEKDKARYEREMQMYKSSANGRGGHQSHSQVNLNQQQMMEMMRMQQMQQNGMEDDDDDDDEEY